MKSREFYQNSIREEELAVLLKDLDKLQKEVTQIRKDKTAPYHQLNQLQSAVSQFVNSRRAAVSFFGMLYGMFHYSIEERGHSCDVEITAKAVGFLHNLLKEE